MYLPLRHLDQLTVIEKLSQRTALPRSPPISVQQLPRDILGNKAYACMPSIASKVWYKNRPRAQLAYTQDGQS